MLVGADWGGSLHGRSNKNDADDHGDGHGDDGGAAADRAAHDHRLRGQGQCSELDSLIKRFSSCIDHADDYSDGQGDNGPAAADYASDDHCLCGQDERLKRPNLSQHCWRNCVLQVTPSDLRRAEQSS